MQGYRIAQLREKIGLSQTELAVKVGTSQKQISKYENGAEPGAEKLALLAQALNTTTDYLMGLTDIAERPLRALGDLNEIEREAIKVLRDLPEADRARALNVLKAMFAEA